MDFENWGLGNFVLTLGLVKVLQLTGAGWGASGI